VRIEHVSLRELEEAESRQFGEESDEKKNEGGN
jgi:hypothetical protein